MFSPNSRAAYKKARQELRAILDGYVKPQTATLPMNALAKRDQARDGLGRTLFDLSRTPASPIRRKSPPNHEKKKKKKRSPPKEKKRTPASSTSPKKKKSPAASSRR